MGSYVNVGICTGSQPYRIALDIPSDTRIVIAEVVVVRPLLHIVILARVSEVVIERPEPGRVLVRKVVPEGIRVRPLPAALIRDVGNLPGRPQVIRPHIE